MKNKVFCYAENVTSESADIYIYGDIVADAGDKWSHDDVCPSDMARILTECKDCKTLNIYINSGGGSVFAGNAIYNQLKNHPAKKTVHIDGLAASIASVIALAGDEIYMPSNAFMMVHKPWSLVAGNAPELRDMADWLDKIEKTLVSVYLDNANDEATEDSILALMEAETWLSASEAAELFPAKIKIVDAVDVAACISDMKYKHMPAALARPTPGTDDEAKKAEAIQLKNKIALNENFLFMEELENDNRNEKFTCKD